MSHTDKTRPGWVQLADPHNKGWLEEWHDHGKGGCDLPATLDKDSFCWFRFNRWNRCIYTESMTALNSGLFPARPRKGGWDRLAREGRRRAQWRRIRQELLKSGGSWDEVDSNKPPRRAKWHG